MLTAAAAAHMLPCIAPPLPVVRTTSGSGSPIPPPLDLSLQHRELRHFKTGACYCGPLDLSGSAGAKTNSFVQHNTVDPQYVPNHTPSPTAIDMHHIKDKQTHTVIVTAAGKSSSIEKGNTTLLSRKRTRSIEGSSNTGDATSHSEPKLPRIQQDRLPNPEEIAQNPSATVQLCHKLTQTDTSISIEALCGIEVFIAEMINFLHQVLNHNNEKSMLTEDDFVILEDLTKNNTPDEIVAQKLANFIYELCKKFKQTKKQETQFTQHKTNHSVWNPIYSSPSTVSSNVDLNFRTTSVLTSTKNTFAVSSHHGVTQQKRTNPSACHTIMAPPCTPPTTKDKGVCHFLQKEEAVEESPCYINTPNDSSDDNDADDIIDAQTAESKDIETPISSITEKSDHQHKCKQVNPVQCADNTLPLSTGNNNYTTAAYSGIYTSASKTNSTCDIQTSSVVVTPPYTTSAVIPLTSNISTTYPSQLYQHTNIHVNPKDSSAAQISTTGCVVSLHTPISSIAAVSQYSVEKQTKCLKPDAGKPVIKGVVPAPNQLISASQYIPVPKYGEVTTPICQANISQPMSSVERISRKGGPVCINTYVSGNQALSQTNVSTSTVFQHTSDITPAFPIPLSVEIKDKSKILTSSGHVNDIPSASDSHPKPAEHGKNISYPSTPISFTNLHTVGTSLSSTVNYSAHSPNVSPGLQVPFTDIAIEKPHNETTSINQTIPSSHPQMRHPDYHFPTPESCDVPQSLIEQGNVRPRLLTSHTLYQSTTVSHLSAAHASLMSKPNPIKVFEESHPISKSQRDEYLKFNLPFGVNNTKGSSNTQQPKRSVASHLQVPVILPEDSEMVHSVDSLSSNRPFSDIVSTARADATLASYPVNSKSCTEIELTSNQHISQKKATEYAQKPTPPLVITKHMQHHFVHQKESDNSHIKKVVPSNSFSNQSGAEEAHMKKMCDQFRLPKHFERTRRSAKMRQKSLTSITAYECRPSSPKIGLKRKKRILSSFYTCRQCTQQFPHRKGLWKHKKEQHPEQMPKRAKKNYHKKLKLKPSATYRTKINNVIKHDTSMTKTSNLDHSDNDGGSVSDVSGCDEVASKNDKLPASYEQCSRLCSSVPSDVTTDERRADKILHELYDVNTISGIGPIQVEHNGIIQQLPEPMSIKLAAKKSTESGEVLNTAAVKRVENIPQKKDQQLESKTSSSNAAPHVKSVMVSIKRDLYEGPPDSESLKQKIVGNTFTAGIKQAERKWINNLLYKPDTEPVSDEELLDGQRRKWQSASIEEKAAICSLVKLCGDAQHKNKGKSHADDLTKSDTQTVSSEKRAIKTCLEDAVLSDASNMKKDLHKYSEPAIISKLSLTPVTKEADIQDNENLSNVTEASMNKEGCLDKGNHTLEDINKDYIEKITKCKEILVEEDRASLGNDNYQFKVRHCKEVNDRGNIMRTRSTSCNEESAVKLLSRWWGETNKGKNVRPLFKDYGEKGSHKPEAVLKLKIVDKDITIVTPKQCTETDNTIITTSSPVRENPVVLSSDSSEREDTQIHTEERGVEERSPINKENANCVTVHNTALMETTDEIDTPEMAINNVKIEKVETIPKDLFIENITDIEVASNIEVGSASPKPDDVPLMDKLDLDDDKNIPITQASNALKTDNMEVDNLTNIISDVGDVVPNSVDTKVEDHLGVENEEIVDTSSPMVSSNIEEKVSENKKVMNSCNVQIDYLQTASISSIVTDEEILPNATQSSPSCNIENNTEFKDNAINEHTNTCENKCKIDDTNIDNTTKEHFIREDVDSIKNQDVIFDEDEKTVHEEYNGTIEIAQLDTKKENDYISGEHDNNITDINENEAPGYQPSIISSENKSTAVVEDSKGNTLETIVDADDNTTVILEHTNTVEDEPNSKDSNYVEDLNDSIVNEVETTEVVEDTHTINVENKIILEDEEDRKRHQVLNINLSEHPISMSSCKAAIPSGDKEIVIASPNPCDRDGHDCDNDKNKPKYDYPVTDDPKFDPHIKIDQKLTSKHIVSLPTPLKPNGDILSLQNASKLHDDPLTLKEKSNPTTLVCRDTSKQSNTSGGFDNHTTNTDKLKDAMSHQTINITHSTPVKDDSERPNKSNKTKEKINRKSYDLKLNSQTQARVFLERLTWQEIDRITKVENCNVSQYIRKLLFSELKPRKRKHSKSSGAHKRSPQDGKYQPKPSWATPNLKVPKIEKESNTPLSPSTREHQAAMTDTAKVDQHRITETIVIESEAESVAPKVWYCLICTFQTDTEEDIHCHSQTKHINLTPFGCPVCKKKGKRYESLEKHILQRHKGITSFVVINPRLRRLQKQVTNSASSPYPRKKTPKHILRRLQKYHRYVDELCNILPINKVPSESVKVKDVTSPERPYECILCEFGSFYEKPLVQHALDHVTIKPFKCVACEAAFKTREEGRAHISSQCTSNRTSVLRVNESEKERQEVMLKNLCATPLVPKNSRLSRKRALVMAEGICVDISASQHLSIRRPHQDPHRDKLPVCDPKSYKSKVAQTFNITTNFTSERKESTLPPSQSNPTVTTKSISSTPSSISTQINKSTDGRQGWKFLEELVSKPVVKLKDYKK